MNELMNGWMDGWMDEWVDVNRLIFSVKYTGIGVLIWVGGGGYPGCVWGIVLVLALL